MTIEEKRSRLLNYCNTTDCEKCKLQASCVGDIEVASEESIELMYAAFKEYLMIWTNSTPEPEKPVYDPVEKPQHYASTSIECIDAMIETQGVPAVIDFCICNAFKYIWRHNQKNGNEDIKKASLYLNKAVELMDELEEPCPF